MRHPTLTIGGALLGGLLLLILLAACAMASSKPTVEQLQHPAPPEPPLLPAETPIRYPVPRQALDTERLLMGPDQRAFEVDELRALWDASPDEPNVRTDLRADPGPHEGA